jgi:hypothetical protein
MNGRKRFAGKRSEDDQGIRKVRGIQGCRVRRGYRVCLWLTKIDFEIIFALLHISRFSFLYRPREGAPKGFRF